MLERARFYLWNQTTPMLTILGIGQLYPQLFTRPLKDLQIKRYDRVTHVVQQINKTDRDGTKIYLPIKSI